MNKLAHATRFAVVSVAAGAVALVAGCGASGSANGSAPVPTSSLAVDQASRDLLPARVKTAGAIRFSDFPNPPYRTVKGNSSSGAEVDLDVALAAVLGVKADVQITSPGDAGHTGILADHYDVYMGPSSLNADRHKQFDDVTYAIATTGTMITKKTNTTFQTADDLCGLKVGVVGSGTNAQITAKSADCTSKGKSAITQLPLSNPNAVVLAVQSGQVEVAEISALDATEALKTNPTLRSVTLTDGIVGQTFDVGLLTLPDLSPALYSAFKVLYSAGEYQRIMEKWGLKDAEEQAPLLNKLYG